jgi:hypothetical protein
MYGFGEGYEFYDGMWDYDLEGDEFYNLPLGDVTVCIFYFIFYFFFYFLFFFLFFLIDNAFQLENSKRVIWVYCVFFAVSVIYNNNSYQTPITIGGRRK